MMRKRLYKPAFFVLLSVSLMPASAIIAAPVPVEEVCPAVEQTIVEAQGGIIEGKVLSKSKKAKVLALRTEGRIEIIKYDNHTRGLEFAETNENVIVENVFLGQGVVATNIKPGLASLPVGVQEIDIEE